MSEGEATRSELNGFGQCLNQMKVLCAGHVSTFREKIHALEEGHVMQETKITEIARANVALKEEFGRFSGKIIGVGAAIVIFVPVLSWILEKVF